MERRRRNAFIVLLIMTAMLLSGCDKKEQQPESQAANTQPVQLLISAAASLTDVMAELGEAYAETAPEVMLTFTFGSLLDLTL